MKCNTHANWRNSSLHCCMPCIGRDSNGTVFIEAINGPYHWPQYQTLLKQVFVLKLFFTSIMFEVEIVLNNSIARNIAKSVLRDGRLQSYLALGRPAWLHDRLL
ncbi:unnamed protein product [Brassica rapa subsp. narinosa]